MRTKKHELCVVDFEVGSMKKSVKVYMVQDLILLTVLGVLLEGLTERFASTILSGTPTIAFALFIVFFAVTRWKLWGLTIIPFLALSTLVLSLASFSCVIERSSPIADMISCAKSFFPDSYWMLIYSMKFQ